MGGVEGDRQANQVRKPGPRGQEAGREHWVKGTKAPNWRERNGEAEQQLKGGRIAWEAKRTGETEGREKHASRVIDSPVQRHRGRHLNEPAGREDGSPLKCW